jgi:hypothetical protein
VRIDTRDTVDNVVGMGETLRNAIVIAPVGDMARVATGDMGLFANGFLSVVSDES